MEVEVLKLPIYFIKNTLEAIKNAKITPLEANEIKRSKIRLSINNTAILIWFCLVLNTINIENNNPKLKKMEAYMGCSPIIGMFWVKCLMKLGSSKFAIIPLVNRNEKMIIV